MADYHADIIDVSLTDVRRIRHTGKTLVFDAGSGQLQKFNTIGVRKRFLGLLKNYTIAVPEEKVNDAATMFQKNLGTRLRKEWYIGFYNAEQVIIVFRKKIFHLSAEGIQPAYQKKLDTTHAVEKDKWDEMIGYAKSLGVPDNQCDFLPEDFRNRDYGV